MFLQGSHDIRSHGRLLAPPLHAAQGNGGMAISETDMDSLGLVTVSYGNQGLNPDLVVESGCRSSNGTVDCTGETVQVRNTLAGKTICKLPLRWRHASIYECTRAGYLIERGLDAAEDVGAIIPVENSHVSLLHR